MHQWDELALAEVYDKYAPAIYRYTFRLLGHQATAQEIAADTFYRLLTALKNGNGPKKNVSAWLYRVAQNLVVNHPFPSPPEEPVPLDNVQISQPDESADAVLLQENADYVRRALWKLTALQQQVIVLRYLEGLNNEEVSEIMGETVGSVKALQHRALASLRRILEKENVQY